MSNLLSAAGTPITLLAARHRQPTKTTAALFSESRHSATGAASPSGSIYRKEYAHRRAHERDHDSGHSLRAGYAAAVANVPGYRIQQYTRHKLAEMVARYVREADKWTKNGLKKGPLRRHAHAPEASLRLVALHCGSRRQPLFPRSASRQGQC